MTQETTPAEPGLTSQEITQKGGFSGKKGFVQITSVCASYPCSFPSSLLGTWKELGAEVSANYKTSRWTRLVWLSG